LLIVRITVGLVIIASFVLLLAYVVTRDKKHVIVIKQLFKYVAWFAIILILLNVISRVIKF